MLVRERERERERDRDRERETEKDRERKRERGVYKKSIANLSSPNSAKVDIKDTKVHFVLDILNHLALPNIAFLYRQKLKKEPCFCPIPKRVLSHLHSLK